ncbi:hypothetical protein [Aquimarina algicola]|uniref:Uncharacterized protein n=1 Tax=Aquimarina algicola TaxID=2589995 RepID=A0A504J7L9_9FLAO|nr:hypothetical protein [Aquimarina algicola]TPN84522.1 hypothetical protein FHK87_16450 [Aquimarina algicola]
MQKYYITIFIFWFCFSINAQKTHQELGEIIFKHIQSKNIDSLIGRIPQKQKALEIAVAKGIIDDKQKVDESIIDDLDSDEWQRDQYEGMIDYLTNEEKIVFDQMVLENVELGEKKWLPNPQKLRILIHFLL